MKTFTVFLLVVGSLLLTACEMAVVERRPVTTRRYVSVTDRDHRVTYRDDRGRVYYRRQHYDDGVTYRTRVNTQRHSYRPGPIDRSYGF